MKSMDAFRKLGWRKSILLVSGLLCWVGAYAFLAESLDWPDAYGFYCRGRGCFFDDLWHSPALLHDGRAAALALFAWLWSMPAFVLIIWCWALWKKRARVNLSLYDDASIEDSEASAPPSRNEALSGDKTR